MVEDGIKTRDEVDELKDNEKYIHQYLNFRKAQEIGIIFGVNDLTPEEISIFYELKSSGIDIQGRNGGQHTN